MMSHRLVRKAIKRLVLLLLISVAVVWAGSELIFQYQKEETDRPPKVVELVIPEGTAELVAQGKPIPSIPENMAFVVGDKLVVRNEDHVNHELGPMWIPAKSSTSLLMETPDNYVATCSFQPSNYLGFDIREPVDLNTRFQAILLAAPTTTVFLFVYSLVAFPLEKEASKDSEQQAGSDRLGPR